MVAEIEAIVMEFQTVPLYNIAKRNIAKIHDWQSGTIYFLISSGEK